VNKIVLDILGKDAAELYMQSKIKEGEIIPALVEVTEENHGM